LADPEYGARISSALGLDFEKVKELSKLSNAELIQQTLKA
jgi:catalase